MAAAIPRDRQLAIDNARAQLYELVKEMGRVRRGSGSLLSRAVEIGPRGHGGAVLVPAADVAAALARIEGLEDRIDELEAELEDLSLAQLVEARRQSPVEDLLSVEELAAQLGRSKLLAEK